MAGDPGKQVLAHRRDAASEPWGAAWEGGRRDR